MRSAEYLLVAALAVILALFVGVPVAQGIASAFDRTTAALEQRGQG